MFEQLEKRCLLAHTIVGGALGENEIAAGVELHATTSNSPPTFEDATYTAEEHVHLAAVLAAADAEQSADELTYRLTGGGPDDSHFVTEPGGRLLFVEAPDFESPVDADGDNRYVVEVEAIDDAGQAGVATVRIEVSDSRVTALDHRQTYGFEFVHRAIATNDAYDFVITYDSGAWPDRASRLLMIDASTGEEVDRLETTQTVDEFQTLAAAGDHLVVGTAKETRLYDTSAGQLTLIAADGVGADGFNGYPGVAVGEDLIAVHQRDEYQQDAPLKLYRIAESGLVALPSLTAPGSSEPLMGLPTIGEGWLAVSAPPATGGRQVHLFSITGPSPEHRLSLFVPDYNASVAIRSDLLAVGLPRWTTDETRTNGTGISVGRVLLYDLSASAFGSVVATIENPSPQVADGFGGVVAIDGDRLAVLARDDLQEGVRRGRISVYDLAGDLARPTTLLDNPVRDTSPEDGTSRLTRMAMARDRIVTAAARPYASYYGSVAYSHAFDTNLSPIAVDDAVVLGEDEPALIDVLANDLDDGPAGAMTLDFIESAYAHGLSGANEFDRQTGGPSALRPGVLTIESNRLRFTPGPEFDELGDGETAVIDVVYRMSDGHGALASGALSIEVVGSNDAPVAGDGVLSASAGGSVTFDHLGSDAETIHGHVMFATSFGTTPANTNSLGSFGEFGSVETANNVVSSALFRAGLTTEYDALATDYKAVYEDPRVSRARWAPNDYMDVVGDRFRTGKPIYNTNGDLIAESFERYYFGFSHAIIGYDESGNALPEDALAWTGHPTILDLTETPQNTPRTRLNSSRGLFDALWPEVSTMRLIGVGPLEEIGDNPLVYTIVEQPEQGVVRDNGDGTFTYDPQGAFDGLIAGRKAQVNFQYTMTDTAGAVSDPATVTIELTGENTDPATLQETLFSESSLPQPGAYEGWDVAAGEFYWLAGKPNADVGGFTDSGAVEVYDPATGERLYTITNPLPARNDRFGNTVALAGHTVVVGSRGLDRDDGRVDVFDLSSGSPVHTASLRNPGFEQGGRGDFGRYLDVDGSVLLVGAPEDGADGYGAGRAFLYDLTDTGAAPLVLTNPSPTEVSSFGVGLSVSGSRVAVGAHRPANGSAVRGAVFLFDTSGNTAALTDTITSPGTQPDKFGESLVLRGDVLIVADITTPESGNERGAVYSYEVDAAGTATHRSTVLNPTGNGPTFYTDGFGHSMSLAGQRLVVGAPWEDQAESDAGVAYVYDVASDGALTYSRVLTGSGERNENYGFAVDITAEKLLVGARYSTQVARDSGAVYAYDGPGGAPGLLGVLSSVTPGVDDNLGLAIALGDELAAARSRFLVQVYDRSPEGLTLLDTIEQPLWDSPGAEHSVAIKGRTVAIGVATSEQHYRQGSVYLYDLTTGSAVLQSIIPNPDPQSSDWFGRALSWDGDRLAVGSRGGAYVYRVAEGFSTTLLTHVSGDPDDLFGNSISFAEGVLAVGSPREENAMYNQQTGAVHVYRLDEAESLQPLDVIYNPTPKQYYGYESRNLSLDDEQRFGESIALDGERLVIGSPDNDLVANNSGKAWVYRIDDAGATLEFEIDNPDPSDNHDYVHPVPVRGEEFGSAVAIQGDTVVIGAKLEDTHGFESGAAYVFDISTGDVVLRSAFGEARPQATDRLARALAIHGETVLLGAWQSDLQDLDRGAVHVLHLAPNTPPTAVVDIATTDQHTPILIEVLGNDTDDDPDDTPDNFSLDGIVGVSYAGPDLGEPLPQSVATIVGESVRFDPAGFFDSLGEGESAEVTVSYRMSDDEGAAATGTAVISVHFVAPNAPPTAVDDIYVVSENLLLRPGPTVAILTDDVDPEGEPLLLVGIDQQAVPADGQSVVTLASGASVTAEQGGTITYDPTTAFDHLRTGETARDEFSYTIVDAGGLTAEGLVEITINGFTDGHEPMRGDFNADGRIDAADYTLWRDQRGASVAPYTGSDADGDGEVGEADYGVWSGNFGATSAPVVSARTGSVMVTGAEADIDALDAVLPIETGNRPGVLPSASMSEPRRIAFTQLPNPISAAGHSVNNYNVLTQNDFPTMLSKQRLLIRQAVFSTPSLGVQPLLEFETVEQEDRDSGSLERSDHLDNAFASL